MPETTRCWWTAGKHIPLVLVVNTCLLPGPIVMIFAVEKTDTDQFFPILSPCFSFSVKGPFFKQIKKTREHLPVEEVLSTDVKIWTFHINKLDIIVESWSQVSNKLTFIIFATSQATGMMVRLPYSVFCEELGRLSL